MKIVIVAVNANYFHTSLSALTLRRMVPHAEIIERNINQPISDTVYEIYSKKPDIVAFSCYIFNFEYVIKAVGNLRKLLPKTAFIAGGMEITYDETSYNGLFDYIIRFEGEISFAGLIKDILGGKSALHNSETVIIDGIPVPDLAALPSPYPDGYLEESRDKIIYYESIRGCPFSCTYCNSSTDSMVRELSAESVFFDINKFVSAHIKIVKFVDRTFNYNIRRAKKIWKYIAGLEDCNTVFHFEAKPELFDKESLELLRTMPRGRIQFEIGIQSGNEKTLDAVCRQTDREKTKHNITSLLSCNNIHIHLDLIAGLPYENYASLKNSLEYLYSFRPHHIQLGILKMLKGTAIRNTKGYLFSEFPPYEILSTPELEFDEVKKIKSLAQITERYYNSHKVSRSIEYLSKTIPISELFERIEQLTDLEDRRLDNLYETLLKIRPDDFILKELLIFDYLCSDKSFNIPKCLKPEYNALFNKGISGHLKRSYKLGIDADTLEIRDTVYDFYYEEKDCITDLFNYEKNK